VTWSPNKLWRSNSIFNLWAEVLNRCNLTGRLKKEFSE
jgi:hypothetical protein